MYGIDIKYITKNTFSNPGGKNRGESDSLTSFCVKLLASFLDLFFVFTLADLMIYPF
jgi:hypothetical protein